MLSDELLAIGLKSNPKNNQSMAEAVAQMQQLIRAKHFDKCIRRQVYNIVKWSAEELNKRGYPYYTIDKILEGISFTG